MQTHARIISGQAVDVTTLDPAELFHPDVAAQFVTVPDGTANGDTFDGEVWAKAAPPVAAPAPYEPLGPMTFYLAFKPAERIAIKASTDPVVQEFWATYDLAVRLDKPIDPNLESVAGGLEYLAREGIITEDRVEPIRRGVAQ